MTLIYLYTQVLLCNMHGVRPKTSLREGGRLRGWGWGINLGRLRIKGRVYT